MRIGDSEFPAKREKGTLGRKIQLRANHYRINLKKPFKVYQYDLDLTYIATQNSKPRDSNQILKNKCLMK